MTAQISLPTDTSEQQIFGTFHAALRVLGRQLGTIYDEKLTKEIGDNWFQQLRVLRAPHYNGLTRFDPAFVLNEPWKHATSPTRQCLPQGVHGFYDTLGKLRRTRNSWAHYDVEPTAQNLIKALELASKVASQVGLACTDNFKAVLARVEDLDSGTFVPSALDASQVWQPVAGEVEAALTREISKSIRNFAKLERPRIGETWIGPLGGRQLRLIPNMRDIWDLAASKSVKHELGESADEVIGSWAGIVGANKDIWVAEDGAVAGVVQGQHCLLGYFGVDPADAEDDLQGFLLPEKYRVKDQLVIKLSTLAPLLFTTVPNIDLVSLEGSRVQLTTLGHVAAFDEEIGEWMRIGAIT